MVLDKQSKFYKCRISRARRPSTRGHGQAQHCNVCNFLCKPGKNLNKTRICLCNFLNRTRILNRDGKYRTGPVYWNQTGSSDPNRIYIWTRLDRTGFLDPRSRTQDSGSETSDPGYWIWTGPDRFFWTGFFPGPDRTGFSGPVFLWTGAAQTGPDTSLR